MSRLLSKDFLSGVMFIAFGLTAMWFGRNLQMGTTVRMGPGYVPHMLAYIMITLGCIVAIVALRIEKDPMVWGPAIGLAAAFVVFRWFVTGQVDWASTIIPAELAALLIALMMVGIRQTPTPADIEMVEAPKWKPITMVTFGIVCFALLFETTGLIPALIAMVLIASLGGDEFKILEVIANIVVLTILCILVFKVGLSMNVYVLRGVW